MAPVFDADFWPVPWHRWLGVRKSMWPIKKFQWYGAGSSVFKGNTWQCPLLPEHKKNRKKMAHSEPKIPLRNLRRLKPLAPSALAWLSFYRPDAILPPNQQRQSIEGNHGVWYSLPFKQFKLAQQEADNKLTSQCRHVAGTLEPTTSSVLQWSRRVQAVDLVRQRRHMISSRSPVGETRADTPQPVDKTMTDGIPGGSFHVRQQDDHLPAQQTQHTVPYNKNSNNRFTALCSRLPGWTSTRRNNHQLAPIVIINHSLSASSIYCNS